MCPVNVPINGKQPSYTSSSAEIRRANGRDVAALLPLFQMYRGFYDQIAESERAEEFLRARIENKESVVFVAVTGNALVGFVQLYPTYSSVAMERVWILNDLFVVSEARRQGIAHQLLVHAEFFARSTNALRLTLKTGMGNLEAQRVYQSLGWKREENFHTFNLPIENTHLGT